MKNFFQQKNVSNFYRSSENEKKNMENFAAHVTYS